MNIFSKHTYRTGLAILGLGIACATHGMATRGIVNLSDPGCGESVIEQSFETIDLVNAGNAMLQAGNSAKADTYYGDAAYFYLTGFFYPQYISAALQLGILDELALQGQRADALAEKLGIKPHLLDLLLRTLHKLGVVQKDALSFSLTRLGNECIANRDSILLLTSKIYDDWGMFQTNAAQEMPVSPEFARHLSELLGSDLWLLPYDSGICHNPSSVTSELGNILLGFASAQIVAFGVTSGIFDNINNDGIHSLETLGAAIKWPVSKEKLSQILEHLQSLHLIESIKGRYLLTPAGQVFLKDNKISLYHGAHVISKEFYAIWRHVAHTIQTGTPAVDQVYKKGFFDYLDAHPDRMKLFGAYMGETMRTWLLPLSLKYPFAGSIIDLGGAEGDVLASILRDNPGVTKAVNFERRGYFVGREPRPGIEQMEGDFFESVPAGFDIYLTSRVFWDWDDEKVIKLLHNIHEAMPPHAQLLVVDGIFESNDNRGNLSGAFFMPMVTTGKTRLLEEFRELYAKTGFKLLEYRRVHDSAMALTLMVLEKTV